MIRTFLFGIVAIFWSAQSLTAQDSTPLFDEAVSAYQRGHFDSAALGLTRLAQSGIDDPRVWYNLGNAHFKSGHVGASLVAFRRGLRLAPRDADLNANYRYARLFAADKIEPVGELFLERWWRVMVDRVAMDEAAWLASLLFVSGALLVVWRWWPSNLAVPKVPFWGVVIVWVAWVVAAGVGASCYARDAVRRDGFVLATQTDVRGGPGDEYALQFVAHDGLAGTVERTESGWHLVQFPNGLKGWLTVGAFEMI